MGANCCSGQTCQDPLSACSINRPDTEESVPASREKLCENFEEILLVITCTVDAVLKVSRTELSRTEALNDQQQSKSKSMFMQ